MRLKPAVVLAALACLPVDVWSQPELVGTWATEAEGVVTIYAFGADGRMVVNVHEGEGLDIHVATYTIGDGFQWYDSTLHLAQVRSWFAVATEAGYRFTGLDGLDSNALGFGYSEDLLFIEDAGTDLFLSRSTHAVVVPPGYAVPAGVASTLQSEGAAALDLDPSPGNQRAQAVDVVEGDTVRVHVLLQDDVVAANQLEVDLGIQGDLSVIASRPLGGFLHALTLDSFRTGIADGGTVKFVYALLGTSFTGAGEVLEVTLLAGSPGQATISLEQLSVGSSEEQRQAFAATSVSVHVADSSATDPPATSGLAVRALRSGRPSLSPVEVRVGARLRFSVLAYAEPDSSDSHIVSDFDWRVPPSLGTPLTPGDLRLSTVAGVTDTIRFHRGQDTADFVVTLTPGSIDSLLIWPGQIVLRVGESVDFDVRALDRYGNEFALRGVNVGWTRVPGEIGTIHPRTGQFTAGNIGTGYIVAVVDRTLRFGITETGVGGSGKVTVVADTPERYGLQPTWPNPFNAETHIRYDLPEPGHVELAVYTISGQHVATLVSQTQAAGTHTVNWQAHGLSTGIYLCHLRAGSFRETRKMLLAR